MNQNLSEQEQVRRNSMEQMRNLGIEPYPAAEFIVTAHADDIKENFDETLEEPRQVAVAGRIMTATAVFRSTSRATTSALATTRNSTTPYSKNFSI